MNAKWLMAAAVASMVVVEANRMPYEYRWTLMPSPGVVFVFCLLAVQGREDGQTINSVWACVVRSLMWTNIQQWWDNVNLRRLREEQQHPARVYRVCFGLVPQIGALGTSSSRSPALPFHLKLIKVPENLGTLSSCLINRRPDPE